MTTPVNTCHYRPSTGNVHDLQGAGKVCRRPLRARGEPRGVAESSGGLPLLSLHLVAGGEGLPHPPRGPGELLAHPWHLVPEEAAKTWRGTRRPRTNTSRPWWTRCSLQKKPFTSSLKDTLAATLRQRAGDKNPEWFKEVLLYDLSKL